MLFNGKNYSLLLILLITTSSLAEPRKGGRSRGFGSRVKSWFGGSKSRSRSSYPKQTSYQNQKPPAYGWNVGGSNSKPSWNQGGQSFAKPGSSFSRPGSSFGSGNVGNRRFGSKASDYIKVGGAVAGGYLAGKAVSSLFRPRYPGGWWNNDDRYYYDRRRDGFYDSRQEKYVKQPPCERPVRPANYDPNQNQTTLNTGTTQYGNVSYTQQLEMYSECLEYFNTVRNQYRGSASSIIASVATLLFTIFVSFGNVKYM